MNFQRDNRHLAWRALGMGLSGAMRAWSPLATLALTYHTDPPESEYKRWPIFRDKLGRQALIALGAAEYVADKWPRTIDRTRLLPQPTHIDGGLIVRSVFAGIAGAALGTQYRTKNSMALGASIGLGSAVLANIAFYHLRKAAGQWSKVHDFTIAMIEDQMCVGLLTAVARTQPATAGPETPSVSYDEPRESEFHEASSMTGVDHDPSDDINNPAHRAKPPELLIGFIAAATACGLALVSTNRLPGSTRGLPGRQSGRPRMREAVLTGST